MSLTTLATSAGGMMVVSDDWPISDASRVLFSRSGDTLRYVLLLRNRQNGRDFHSDFEANIMK